MSVRLALRGLLARPLRTVLTALAIVVGVATISGALSLTGSMRSASDALSADAYDRTEAVVAGRSAFLPNPEFGKAPGVPAATVDEVRAVPGVTTAIGEVTDFETKVLGKDGKPVGDGPYFGIGVDAGAGAKAGVTPFRLLDGAWPRAGQVALDKATAEDEGLAVGDRVRVQAEGPAREYVVSGLLSFGSVEQLGTATVTVFDLPTGQAALGRGDRVDQVLVDGRAGVEDALQAALGTRASVIDAADQDRYDLEILDTITGVLTIVLTAFGIIVVLVGGFTIANALSLSVAQRTRELGVLRALGAGRGRVLRTVLAEALLLGLGATALGLLGGVALEKGLRSLFDALGLGLPIGPSEMTAGTIVAAGLVGVGVTALAGLWPAWKATRVAPVAALRAADAERSRPGLAGRAVAAIAGVVGRPGQLVGGLAGGLARRNAQRQPGRTLATAAALVVGVTLVVCVSVIGAGLKDETTSSLERRVAATHVLTGENGFSVVDSGAAEAAAKAPGVAVATGIRQDQALAFGDEETVNAVDGRALAGVFRFDYAEGGQDDLRTLGRDGAIVDAGFAEEHELALGDRFSVTAAGGTEVPLVVRAIEDSPVLDVLSLGPVTMDRAAFDRAFGQDRDRLVFLSGSGEGLERALAAWPGTKVSTTGEWIDEAAAALDPLMAVLVILLALAVLVSLFGIANTLVLATVERTPEIGMLRAIGMGRRQTRRMVRHEAIATALLGAGIGIPLGLGLAYAVTSALADEGLAFAVPGGTLIAVVVVAILAGCAAAALPARRAARLDPLAALAWE